MESFIIVSKIAQLSHYAALLFTKTISVNQVQWPSASCGRAPGLITV